MQNIITLDPRQITAQRLAEARRIIANPAQYADRPHLFRIAWVALTAQRAQPCAAHTGTTTGGAA